ncbi:DUF3991 domain-containing protein [Lacticaseibacillus suibinensis]|uniref:DUF3991 domain-containing protein n=1 Tax=Lacticaseibacillus suibinensis TaxID=2486011 RepID=UPI000F7914F7|nr:DUF3991 domain-containing protein [Lacticaseibacillus suibinensis]
MDETKRPEAESVPGVAQPAVGNFDEVRQQGEAARTWWKEQLIAHPGQSMKVERVDKDGESTLFKTLTPSARGSHSWQLTSFLPSGAPQSHVDIIGKTPEDWKLDKVVGELPFSRGEGHYRVVWQSSTEHSQERSANGKITTAMITKAKQTSILDIATQNGVQLISDGGKYYHWAEHDSLVVDIKANLWRWNSQNLGGDAIAFMQKVVGPDNFKSAVITLAHGDLAHVEVKEEKRNPFSYYLKDSTDFNKARDYLVNVRKLHPQLIDKLHKVGLIQQDEYGRAIFVWKQAGQKVGATIQGTSTDREKYGKHGAVKKIAKNSEKDFGFNFTVGKPRKLMIFESPIDALSFMTVNPRVTDSMLFSMDGVKQESAIQALGYFYRQTGHLPEKIGIGTDNDQAGQKFYHEFAKFHESRAYSDQVPLVKLIATDSQIPAADFALIQVAAKQHGIAWPQLAAAAKEMANFDTGNVAPKTYYQALAKSLTPEADKESLKTIGVTVIDAKPSAWAAVVSDEFASRQETYERGNYQLVEHPAKDWNDIAKAVSKAPLGKTIVNAKAVVQQHPVEQRELHSHQQSR